MVAGMGGHSIAFLCGGVSFIFSVYMQQTCLSRFFVIAWCKRLAVWLVADFESLSYQVTTAFDTGCDARIRIIPAINYTACYGVVFMMLTKNKIDILLNLFVKVFQ